ncbi:MAG: calcium/proton exchanger [Anaerolineaceae bacterium]|nr:calcium/proton exchanger [Anaerolineaceae bacterium]
MFSYLLILVPVSLILSYLVDASPVWVFFSSVLAIVPLAVWIRRATEQLAHRTSPSIGGLLNISFGNAAELVLALFVLLAGNTIVVKGQITGSIIGNSLLGLGLAVVVGTWGKQNLKFNRDQAGLLSTLLMLVLVGLLLPAIFDFTERDIANAPNALVLDETLSLAVSVVLILLYVGNLIYTLVTHDDIFSANDKKGEKVKLEITDQNKPWPLWKSILILISATAVTALEAEFVSGALEETAGMIGVSTFFLGVIVLAVIGNAAEYVSAVYFAKKGDMDLVMTITVGSTVQVALFVAPLLVLISYLIGKPMDLVFNNPIELIAIASVAFIINAISKDGDVTWFEGALLLGVYLLMAIAFFLVTPT